MQITAGNVRILLDTKNSRKPKCMTAISGHELSRYSIDIAALSETRLADTVDLMEAGSGYTFIWSSGLS